MTASAHIFDLDPSTKQNKVVPFKADASCFSPLADRKAPPPSCANCGADAKGGTFIDMDSGYPIGQVTGTVEFTCGCDGKAVYSIIVENIDQWQLFRQLAPGVFRVKKKTQTERIKEIQSAGS